MKIFLLATCLILTACSHKPAANHAGEQAAAEQKTAQPSACMAYNGKPVPKSFADFDADKSGSVSRNEYLCQVVKHFTALNKDGDDYLEGQEISVPVKHSDENGDGKISIVEFMQTAEIAFDFSDKNHSGDLSKAEFKAANRRLP